MPGLKLAAGAKRTAFGDVSNTARPVSEVIVKGSKPQVVAGFGKENGKPGAFNVPAQRPKHHASVASFVPIHTTNQSRVANVEPVDSKLKPALLKPHLARKATVIFKDTESQQPQLSEGMSSDILPETNHEAKSSEPLSVTQAIPIKSPRHYKSQPYLRPEQPLLRRTQSRLLNSNKLIDADIIAEATEAPYVDAVEDLRILDWPVADSIDRASAEEAPPVESQAAEVQNIQLIPIKEVVPTAPIPASEVEEYWDEDEEFYDDQGYTTAHSYRSFGDNTTGGVTTIIVPKVTGKIQKELDAAKIWVEANMTQEDIDEEMWDVSMVAEYGDDIYNYMRELEVRQTDYGNVDLAS